MAYQFGQIIPSALTSINEIAPALATLNFDFSLYKVEAPAEFQEVGRSLSKLRRENAEFGQQHVTARKLGALFATVIPNSPKLLTTYGLRASEIASASSTKKCNTSEFGFFADRAGLDATTIWASATSGPHAIAVHLLACMLAQIWDAPEAISIWIELVKRRSEEVLNSFNDTNAGFLADIAAARQEISRESIAEWDASARAWLRIAGQCKAKEQKQLRLILDNLGLHRINNIDQTYESVLDVWTKSLNLFESLLNGASQKIVDAGPLLALSVWHLYPNLVVVYPVQAEVIAKDPLLRTCGVLTIGLQRSDGKDSEESGLSWSLPLAYLRHYGLPEIRQSIFTGSQRLTIPEFLQTFLGAFLQSISNERADVHRLIRCLDIMHQMIEVEAQNGLDLAKEIIESCENGSWLGYLFRACKDFLTAKGNDYNRMMQLVQLGKKHGETFLGSCRPDYRFLGFLRDGNFARTCKTTEDIIDMMRKIAAELPGGCRDYIILKKNYYESEDGRTFDTMYASAKPMIPNNRKRTVDGETKNQTNNALHCRWLNISEQKDRSIFRESTPDSNGFFKNEKYLNTFTEEELQNHKGSMEVLVENIQKKGENVFCARDIMDEEVQVLHTSDDILVEIIPGFYDHITVLWPTPSYENGSYMRYNMILDGDTSYLFVAEDIEIEDLAFESICLQQMLSLFENGPIDTHHVVSALCFHLSPHSFNEDRHSEALKATASAMELYRNAEGATVDVRVLQNDLLNMKWVPKLSRYPYDVINQIDGRPVPAILESWRLSSSEAFSCLCFFESGRFDIDVNILKDVIAMSSGESMYVLSRLLHDPWEETTQRSPVTHITGNIGRSGIALMVTPKFPLVRRKCIENFREVVHRPFEGELQDKFKNTSLHLSFTTAIEYISTGGFTGSRDQQIYLIESLLSIYDRGKWVADLNFKKATRSSFLTWENDHHWCRESKSSQDEQLSVPKAPDISCIENWSELIDEPETCHCVFQAHGNWQARLAASVLSEARGYWAVVWPGAPCFDCNVLTEYGPNGPDVPLGSNFNGRVLHIV